MQFGGVVGSFESGGEWPENHLFTRNSKAHMVAKPEFLLCKAEKALEIGVSQERDGDDISAPILADIDGEMSLGNAVVGRGSGCGILFSA